MLNEIPMAKIKPAAGRMAIGNIRAEENFCNFLKLNKDVIFLLIFILL